MGCTTSPKFPSQQDIIHVKIDTNGLIAQSSGYMKNHSLAYLKEFRLNNTIHQDYVEVIFAASGCFELKNNHSRKIIN